MTNIVKETLVEKQIAISDKINNLLAAEKEIITNRVKVIFKDAFDYLPVEVTMGYDSIYFKVDRREILSISKKYNGEAYLNTYSTFIEDDFELKRLIFNGMIAKVVLENPNIYKEIYADTELKEEIAEAKEQLSTISQQIRLIEKEEANMLYEKKLGWLKCGEEIEFDKLKTIDYRRGEDIRRVKSLKVKMTSKAKGTVTFQCESWTDGTLHTYVRENVNIERYILPHLI